MHRLSRRVVLFILTAAALSLGAAGVALAAQRVGFRHVHGAGARQQAFWRHLRAKSHRSGFRQAHASGIGAGDSGLAFEAAQSRLRADRAGGHRLRAGAHRRRPAGRRLGRVGGPWQTVTTQPYNAQPANYTDPFWSNIGAGFSIVGGRVTALATTRDGAWFAGAADGGVWRSYDQGAHWTPVTDAFPTCPPAPSRSTRQTARCGWAPARPMSSRTPTRATASGSTYQRRQVLAEGGRPGQPDRSRARSSASPSTGRRRVCGHQQRLVPLGRGSPPMVGGARPGRSQPISRPTTSR